MKKLIALIVLACAISTATIGVVGCKTTPTVQRVSVNTLFSIHKTVDAAFDGYLQLIVKGTLATNSLPKVAASYRDFQRVYTIAVIVVGSDTNAVVPLDVAEASSIVLNNVKQAKRGAL